MLKNSFLNLPISKENSKYNATFIGINYCSKSFLKGVELGANKIREVSQRYSNFDGSSYPLKIYNSKEGYILEKVIMNDYGNISELNDLKKLNVSSFLVFIGGDHSVTYHIIRNVYNHCENVIILHFDAHSDMLNEWDDCPHGSVMRKLTDYKGIKQIFHIGLRGNLNTGPGIEYSLKKGNKIITTKKLKNFMIKRKLRKNKIYITFDTDYFDPSIAPGTNSSEPDGNFYNETILILRELIKKYDVIGMDIVEYNPLLDNSDVTAILLTNLVMEVISSKCN